ncbi:MAG: RDD family protein [Pseudomonadota bacterium]|nr:RDD family protein [Pseudomonadota bacterium]
MSGQTYEMAQDYQRVDPARLDNVRTRRVLAFLIDYAVVFLLMIPAAILVFIFGIFTLGLLWFVYPVLGLVVALIYVGTTMGGPYQATPGMRFFSIRIQRDNGDRIDGITAVVHAVLFWVFHVTLTPFLLIVSLFSARKKLLQDILLGTVIVRSDR